MVNLIEIKARDFSAMVVPYKELPVMEVLPIIAAQDDNIRFALMFEKLRDSISVELRPMFDSLNQDEIIKVFYQWAEMEQREEL
jgi:hypothetical protein